LLITTLLIMNFIILTLLKIINMDDITYK
jgi:hypothetical protein